MTAQSRFSFDSRQFVKTKDGYIFPVTLAAEDVRKYGEKSVYFPMSSLIHATKDARDRDIPLVLEHPEVMDGAWDVRATVGKVPGPSIHVDFLTNKLKGDAFIPNENEWVAQGISSGEFTGVSIGFESVDTIVSGEYDGQTYELRQDNATLDHLAICGTDPESYTEPRCPYPECGFNADSKHTDPEETEDFIRIPIRDAVTNRIRTIVMSSEKGIQALVEIVRGKSKVITMMFKKSKGWTMDSARAWMEAHKPHASNADSKMATEEKPTEKVSPPTPKVDSDCTERENKMIAAYEQKITDARASAGADADAKIAALREEFTKKMDSVLDAVKPKEPAKSETKAQDAEDHPAKGGKSVKGASSDADDDVDFEALKKKTERAKYKF